MWAREMTCILFGIQFCAETGEYIIPRENHIVVFVWFKVMGLSDMCGAKRSDHPNGYD
jgi:hypothetical protein